MKFSAYLRGIETNKSAPHLSPSPLVFSLPTRNWNLQQVRPNKCNIQFSAYLRGIETQRSSSNKTGGGRFQPTYEELKPMKLLNCTLHELSFQPTYEELKHIRHIFRSSVFFWFSAYLRGIETWHDRRLAKRWLRFQPTYEELKQHIQITSKKSQNCFQPTYEELKQRLSVRGELGH